MPIDLTKFDRIVIKIGSALLVDRESGLKSAWLESLCSNIASLAKHGVEMIVVSSGAIALGRTILELPPVPLKLEESQASAAVGQIELARCWTQSLGSFQLRAGQILLTLGDTEDRRRYLNARATIETLLSFGAIPIINENDSVATSEIRYGDNDRLAARVASMVGADLLILLSDIDGLYDQPPATHPDAKRIPIVSQITEEIEKMAGDAGTELSRGGMVTKIEAAKMATEAGTAMIIASGKIMNPLMAISNKDATGAEQAGYTWFQPTGTPIRARKKWIAGQMEVMGSLTIDAGAIAALRSGKSLLPAGVKAMSGEFSRGDFVRIFCENGKVLGCGLVAYDSSEASRIAGRKSCEIEALLGYPGRSEMIHRNDLALRD